MNQGTEIKDASFLSPDTYVATSIWKRGITMQATRRILLKPFCYMFTVLGGYLKWYEIQCESKKVKI